MTPISPHIFKKPTTIGLSFYGVCRFIIWLVVGVFAVFFSDESLAFVVFVPVMGLVYAFEFFATRRESERDAILEVRLCYLLTDLGVPHSWLCALFGHMPPLHRVRGWKTRRRFYGP